MTEMAYVARCAEPGCTSITDAVVDKPDDPQFALHYVTAWSRRVRPGIIERLPVEVARKDLFTCRHSFQPRHNRKAASA
jgi:hypothetical protein